MENLKTNYNLVMKFWIAVKLYTITDCSLCGPTDVEMLRNRESEKNSKSQNLSNSYTSYKITIVIYTVF